MATIEHTRAMSHAGSPVWFGGNEAFVSCSRNIFGEFLIHSHYTYSAFGRVVKSELRHYISQDSEIWYEANGDFFEGHGPLVNIRKLVSLANSLGYYDLPIRVQRMLKHYEFGFDYIQLHAPYDTYLFALDGCLHDPLNQTTDWSVLTKRFAIIDYRIPDTARLRLASAALEWLEANEATPLIGTFARADAVFKQHALM
jgi:hypothetical protein